MLTRDSILESMKGLPDMKRFSVDEITDSVILLDRIGTGLEQVSKGQVVTEEEFNNRLSKWLK